MEASWEAAMASVRVGIVTFWTKDTDIIEIVKSIQITEFVGWRGVGRRRGLARSV
jgi:hypothetical protein